MIWIISLYDLKPGIPLEKLTEHYVNGLQDHETYLFGLPEYMHVDTLDVIEAADREEALVNDAAVPVTPEIQTIYNECDLFLDKSRERYQLWFSPLVAGRAAQAGIPLG